MVYACETNCTEKCGKIAIVSISDIRLFTTLLLRVVRYQKVADHLDWRITQFSFIYIVVSWNLANVRLFLCYGYNGIRIHFLTTTLCVGVSDLRQPNSFK